MSDLKLLLTRYVAKQTPTRPPPFDDVDGRPGQGPKGSKGLKRSKGSKGSRRK